MTNIRPTCRIDPTILNAKTLTEMDDIGLSFFASVCGKNRGAFIMDPPDGHTYGCLELPTNITELLGIAETVPDDVSITDANSIKDQFVGQNITADDALTLLNFLVERSYHSTPSVATNPYGCDVNGLAQLSCHHPAANTNGDNNDTNKSRSPRKDGQPIRSVNLIGLLIENEQPWMKQNQNRLIEYTVQDYEQMIDMGLNTVQIKVPTSVFVSTTDDNSNALKDLLDTTLADIARTASSTTGNTLQVILSLVATGDELDAVVEASKYARLHNDNVLLGLTLPSGMKITTKTMIDSIRAAEIDHDESTTTTTNSRNLLSVFLPYTVDDLLAPSSSTMVPDVARDIDDPNVYGSVSWEHTTSIGDIASSTSQEDRSKLFYHENVACTIRSPFEHSSCFGTPTMPIFWSSGFDVSIDDCAINDDTNQSFKDYGQCDRFDETIASGWWERHRASFAARQLYAAEKGGLGWSYTSWKLGSSTTIDEVVGTDMVGVIDQPVQLLSLKEVHRAGLFPNLVTDTAVVVAAQSACLNPPVNDFALGDDTLAPTMAPLPDCGNGWWNSTTSQCDYWVPPPEPTMSPTEPCPVLTTAPPSASTSALVMSSIGGAVAMLILGMIHKYCVAKKKNNDYSPIPN